MHGSVPFYRLLNGVLQPSSSRIPHLSLHILRRQTRARAHCTTEWQPRNLQHQRRFQSSITIGSSFFPVDSTTGNYEHNDTPTNTSRLESTSALTPDAGSASQSSLKRQVSMEELLEENHPERILLGFVTPSIGDAFVADADDETFARAICALDPDYFILPFRDIHRHIKPTLETEPRFRYVKSFEERVGTFYHVLDTLVTLRQERGHAITLDVYRHLLRCAAAGGYGNMARVVFCTLMPENEIVPDVDCYNYFMEALNWNLAYGRFERYSLRVIPKHMYLRSQKERLPGFRGHTVVSPTLPNDEQSLRLEVLRTFNELVRRGLKGDEATFCNLITAMGREGDISSVRSVLKSVWNIDLDALERYDEEEVESPTFYKPDSPLKPTERLLQTVVHTFSTNNQVDKASMLVDYISRNYNIPIPASVWTHLLEWTALLSLQLGGVKFRNGDAAGRVSFRALEALWTAFHDEPYNVPVTIVDQMYRVKGRFRGKRLELALRDLRVCVQLLDEDRTKVSQMYDKMREYLRTNYDHIFAAGVPSAEFLQLKREFLFASLRLDCHIQLISTAVRNMFKESWWNVTTHRPYFRQVTWPLRLVPDLVQEWAEFLPNIIPYYTTTGHVTISGQEHREKAMVSANSAQTTFAGSMRAMFDTYSPARLRHSVDYVYRGPKGLAAFDAEAASFEDDGDQRYTDWVLREEKEQRSERLSTVKYGQVNPPGPDWRVDEWHPWAGPGNPSKK